MMSILIEQLINITDAIFLGHVGEIELGASALAGIWYLAIYMLGFGFSLGLQVVILIIWMGAFGDCCSPFRSLLYAHSWLVLPVQKP